MSGTIETKSEKVIQNVLKIKWGEDLYRVTVLEPQFNYDDICRAIEIAISRPAGSYVAKYLDEDGDSCTFCVASFSDFAVTACAKTNDRRLFKLEIHPAIAAIAQPQSPSRQLQSGDNISFTVRSHSGDSIVAHASRRHFGEDHTGIDTGRVWILRQLSPGPASSACILKLEGDPSNCVLRSVEDNLALEVDCRKMEEGTKIWLWNDDPAVPTQSHSRFSINTDGTISPHKSCPGAGGLCPTRFVLGVKKNVVVLVERETDARPLFVKIANSLPCTNVAQQIPCSNRDRRAMWFLVPRKFLWLLCRYRASGACIGKAIASLLVHWLPEIAQSISNNIHVEEGNLKAYADGLLQAVRNLLEEREDFRNGKLAFPGIVKCIASEWQHLLNVVLSLTFESQIDVVSRAIDSQKEQLERLLDDVDAKTPDAFKPVLEHINVTCDGCGAKPLLGPRFKCESCADYDLCGECYANKGSVHPLGNHSFQCIVLDWGSGSMQKIRTARAAMPAWAMAHGWKTSNHKSSEPRPCAAGCGFMATWHPTHCCARCAFDGSHGMRCQRRAVQSHEEKQVDVCHSAPPLPPISSGVDVQSSAPPLAPICSRQVFFPVVFEDGRRLEIQWHLGEDPVQVASTFARQHGVLAEEVTKITQFVADATKMAQEQTLKEDTQQMECTHLAKPEGPERIALKNARDKLEEVGLGDMDAEVLRVMMADAHYDVESVIAMLTQ